MITWYVTSLGLDNLSNSIVDSATKLDNMIGSIGMVFVPIMIVFFMLVCFIGMIKLEDPVERCFIAAVMLIIPNFVFCCLQHYCLSLQFFLALGGTDIVIIFILYVITTAIGQPDQLKELFF